jgi:hypothetical protein
MPAIEVFWSAVHGAVSLELAGPVIPPVPAASYEVLLRWLVSGLGRPGEERPLLTLLSEMRSSSAPDLPTTPGHG